MSYYSEYYKLSCPSCGGTALVIREEDIDEDGKFIGDPKIGCAGCGYITTASALVPQETSDGQIIHMARGR